MTEAERSPLYMLFFCFLYALAVLPAAAEDHEEYRLYLPGVVLEWERESDNAKPVELTIKDLDDESAAARLGYREDDRIVVVGRERLNRQKLHDWVPLSAEAKTFHVQRDKKEVQLPSLFRTTTLIKSEKPRRLKLYEPAPPIEIHMAGRKQTYPHELTGKVVLINFWATWCKPCMEEMPELTELRRDYGWKGFVVVSINIDSELQKFKGYLSKNRLPFILAHMSGLNSKPARAYGVRSLPTNVFIDRKGRVAMIHTGYSPRNTQKTFARTIEVLLDRNNTPLVISPK